MRGSARQPKARGLRVPANNTQQGPGGLPSRAPGSAIMGRRATGSRRRGGKPNDDRSASSRCSPVNILHWKPFCRRAGRGACWHPRLPGLRRRRRVRLPPRPRVGATKRLLPTDHSTQHTAHSIGSGGRATEAANHTATPVTRQGSLSLWPRAPQPAASWAPLPASHHLAVTAA